MRFLSTLLITLMVPLAAAAADRGKEAVGEVEVVVYFGTNDDPAKAGERTTEVPAATAEQLRRHEPLEFTHYRLLGSDRQKVYRSYENWAQPIKGSDEILCRFETESVISRDTMRLDLELWLSRKKILKSGMALTHGKPVLVLGPEWRGGRLIVAVELAPPPGSGP
ncbi:hypothetical protein [Haloferula sp. A504]|uniref:hypothetical protein n=1 Tax=Haloferula sp. A504 TaxID=3373601 RepID=UPI0031C155EA|nr:hypothetical protein [Verrucomicrobiaceae bacterium E54]